MRIIIIIVLIFVTTAIYPQNVITYRGVYSEPNPRAGMQDWILGNAIYQYYEAEDFERIYNGTFILKSNRASDSYTIEGGFKNNKRDGKWRVEYYNNTFKFQESITVFYKDGMLDGECSSVGIGGKKVVLKSKAIFKNNCIIGNYQYHFNTDGLYIDLSANYNSLGQYDGIFLVKIKSLDGVVYEDRREYLSNTMIARYFRNMSNGEFKIKYKLNDSSNLPRDVNKYDFDPFERFSTISNTHSIQEALTYWYPPDFSFLSDKQAPLYIMTKGLIQ